MKVGIQGIGLLAAGLEGWRAGRAVLAGTEPFAPVAVPDPEAALLPQNERRRSSDCVRWAVHVAQEAIVQSGLDPREVPTVFASSGGEMGVLDMLCRTLATPERDSRIAGNWGHAFGTLAAGTDFDGIIARAMPH